MLGKQLYIDKRYYITYLNNLLYRIVVNYNSHVNARGTPT